MNLRQLEAFRATMEAGSITGAAELMHISQPSVSRLIADLERSVGFSLFMRVGRGLVATVEARRFYQSVESMFIGVDRLQELANTIRTTAGGIISVGVIPTFSEAVVPEAVSELYRSKPDVRIMLSTRNTPAIVDAVRMQQFDLGVVGREPPYEGVETLFQTSVPYVCLLPEEHAAAKQRGPLDLEELAKSDVFITFGGAYPDNMLDIDRKLSQALESRARLSATNMPLMASLVRTTGALAIVDPFSASIAVQRGGVALRPIRQNLTYRIAVITRGADILSREAGELANAIIGHLAEVCATIE
ncbi:MAG: LysR family transcriptional regulator [Hyphomicrobiaceae bacterium]